MMRKGIVAAMVLVGLWCVWQLTSPLEAEQDKKEKKAAKARAPYVHAVAIYLKKDAPQETAAGMIADAHALLAKIPAVKGVWAGRPADKHTPKYAVTDYQVGLLVLCENYEGLTAYLEHELHLEYVKRYDKHLEKVLVWDFLNQAK